MTRTASVIFSAGVLVFANLAPAQSQSLPSAKRTIELTGVNIAGAEFGEARQPGKHGVDYVYPEPSAIDYFASKGMNIIRLPVLWERLQHRLGAKLDEAEMQRIDAVVNYAASKDIKVVIDIHNYARYMKVVIGSRKLSSRALGELWRQIAARYKGNDHVVFGLMNEPVGLRTETWLVAANVAIAEIRRAGAKNLILVPGNGWSSARDWPASKYGTPNSIVMKRIADPIKHYAFEVHQYFDWDFTGTHADCQSLDIGAETLAAFTKWARENRKRGFLGEFGAGSNETCLTALERVLQFMADNSDVWIGWTFWAGGAWWPKDYYTNVEPLEGRDRPQMQVLEKYTRHDRPARQRSN